MGHAQPPPFELRDLSDDGLPPNRWTGDQALSILAGLLVMAFLFWGIFFA